MKGNENDVIVATVREREREREQEIKKILFVF